MSAVCLSEGGMALDAHGNLADLPRDTAAQISDELLDVVTLLHSVMSEVDEAAHGPDRGPGNELTSPTSRAVSLALMADAKVRAVLSTMVPYI